MTTSLSEPVQHPVLLVVLYEYVMGRFALADKGFSAQDLLVHVAVTGPLLSLN
jgi:hypothetical protein